MALLIVLLAVIGCCVDAKTPPKQAPPKQTPPGSKWQYAGDLVPPKSGSVYAGDVAQPSKSKVIHFWAIRHVESTHNAGETPPVPPPKEAGEKGWWYNYWDAPPSRAKGPTQLQNVLNNFGKAVMADGALKDQLKDAKIVQFESSDLCRATLTSLNARKSLITAAASDKEITPKLTGINNYMCIVLCAF